MLYFENLSRDTTDVYLADGLTEDITAKLGQVNRLVVTSHAAVRRLHDAASMPTASLGRTLNVGYLVSGSIQRSGDRLRVTVELLRAQTGARVWGDQYDRTAADVLAIQEDIARAVAGGIAGRLLPNEQATIAARPTRSPEAYDHYLRGNRLLWRQNESTIFAAIREYETAVRLDANFTAARGRLAFAYGFLLNWSYRPDSLPPDSVFARGVAATDRALREDSTSSDALLGRAMVLFFGGRNADLPQAVTSARAAAFDTDSAIALDSSFASQFAQRARIRVALGDLPGALADATHALRIATTSERTRGSFLLAEMEARNGARDSALALMRRSFTTLGWPSGIPPSTVSVRNVIDPALAALTLRMPDVAIGILEQARPRSAWLWSYLYWQDFDPLRNDARFDRIYEEAKPPGAPEVPR